MTKSFYQIMEYSYPYRHPGLNQYVYPQAPATRPGFAVHSGAMNPMTTGITASSNQSAQSVGISVNINPPESSPVSAKLSRPTICIHVATKLWALFRVIWF